MHDANNGEHETVNTHTQCHDQTHAEVDEDLHQHFQHVLDHGFVSAHGSKSHEPKQRNKQNPLHERGDINEYMTGKTGKNQKECSHGVPHALPLGEPLPAREVLPEAVGHLPHAHLAPRQPW